MRGWGRVISGRVARGGLHGEVERRQEKEQPRGSREQSILGRATSCAKTWRQDQAVQKPVTVDRGQYGLRAEQEPNHTGPCSQDVYAELNRKHWRVISRGMMSYDSHLSWNELTAMWRM